LENLSVSETVLQGVAFDGADDTELRDSRVFASRHFGVEVDDSAGLTIADTWIDEIETGEGPSYGIDVDQSVGFTATNVTVTKTDYGLRLASVTGSAIQDSHVRNVLVRGIEIRDSTTGGEATTPDEYGEPAVTGVTVADTVVENTVLEPSGEQPGDGIAVHHSFVDVVDSEIENAGANGIRLDPATSTLENVSVTGAGKDGVVAPSTGGSSVSIVGSDTDISDNGGHGGSIEDSCFEGECAMHIADATIANNGDPDVRAASPQSVLVTAVDLGASTTAETTVTAELSGASLAGVDSAPSAPDDREDLGRYVGVQAARIQPGRDEPPKGGRGCPATGRRWHRPPTRRATRTTSTSRSTTRMPTSRA